MSRPLATVCKRGHPMTEENHCPRGYCRKCRLMREATYRAEIRAGKRIPKRRETHGVKPAPRRLYAILPAAPLRLAMADAGVSLRELGRRMDARYGTSSAESTMGRIFKAQWITPDTADDAAVALGLHPFQIWPDWFELEGVS